MESYCENTTIDIRKYHLGSLIPLMVFLSITAFTSTLLNTMVILTIWRTPTLQKPSMILLCSLALTDLLVGLIVEPAFIIYCIAALMRWCGVFRNTNIVTTRLGYALATLSITTLLAIAVDRFLAIKIKTQYKHFVTRRRSLILVIFLWLVPGGIIAVVIQFRKSSKEDTKVVVISAIMFILSIALLYAWCFQRLKKLSLQTLNAANPALSGDRTSHFNTMKYRRSLVTMVMVVALILFSFLPVVGYFSTHTLDEVFNNPAIGHLCESFVLLNSTLNPILYLWRMKDLRQALKNILGCHNLT